MVPRGWGLSDQGGRHDVRSNEIEARCRHICNRGLGASTVHVDPVKPNLETTLKHRHPHLAKNAGTNRRGFPSGYGQNVQNRLFIEAITARGGLLWLSSFSR